jgi:hypothetical protein
VASIIKRVDLVCASNLMRVPISLTDTYKQPNKKALLLSFVEPYAWVEYY